MKNQKRENEEKDRDTHRQEIKEATGREKVGEGAIRKRRTQEEIATKIAEDKDTKEKVEKGKEYTDIESFLNRTKLWEIEIKGRGKEIHCLPGRRKE